MYRTEDVLATLGMIRQHKLDVRTVTMGVDLHPCASPDLSALCGRIGRPSTAGQMWCLWVEVGNCSCSRLVEGVAINACSEHANTKQQARFC